MNERLRLLMAEMLDIPADQVRADLRRTDTDAWDSLNHLRLISAIESEFAAVFTMDEIVAAQTPADLQRVIDSARAAGSSVPGG